MTPHSKAKFDALVLPKGTLRAALRTNREQPSPENRNIEISDQELAAVCFGEALIRMGWEPKEVAGKLKVSDNLVRRWANPHQRESPSQIQLTALGADFQEALKRSYSIRYGWGRKALLDLLSHFGDAAADIAADLDERRRA